MRLKITLIIIAQLIYHVECLEDLSPCKYQPKFGIICDGSVAKITDEALKIVGSKLANKTFEKIRIFNTSVINILEHTFEETIFRSIEISNNTLLKTIEENAFNRTDRFWDLYIQHNSILEIDSIFSLYKSLNPVTFYVQDQNIKEIPHNAFRIPESENKLEAIILSSNKIRVIRKNSFTDCPNIRYIELNNNMIEVVEDFGFNLTVSNTYLNEIRLSNNKLKTSSFTNNTIILNKMSDKVPFLLHLENNSLTDLPELVFKPWFEENDHFLYASGNQFKCECDMKWILHQSKNPSGNKRFNEIFCQNKNKFIDSLSDKDFNC